MSTPSDDSTEVLLLCKWRSIVLIILLHIFKYKDNFAHGGSDDLSKHLAVFAVFFLARFRPAAKV